MNTLFTILVILIVLAAILLVAVVLLQNGKGDGLASNFVAGNQTFGVRQTADILEKVTWVLVAVIVVLSVIASFANPKGSKQQAGSELADEEEAIEAPAAEADTTDAESTIALEDVQE